MSKINLKSKLLTETRRKAAENMRKTHEVVDDRVRKWPRFSITVPFVWR